MTKAEWDRRKRQWEEFNRWEADQPPGERVEPEEFRQTVERLCRQFRGPGEPFPFVERTRVLPVSTAAGIRVDIVFVALPEEKRMIARSRMKQIGQATVRVAAAEDLVLMKLISERPQDLEDAHRLLRRFRKTLDRGYLEPRLLELAEAFGRPDILGVSRAEMKL